MCPGPALFEQMKHIAPSTVASGTASARTASTPSPFCMATTTGSACAPANTLTVSSTPAVSVVFTATITASTAGTDAADPCTRTSGNEMSPSGDSTINPLARTCSRSERATKCTSWPAAANLAP